MMTTAEGWNDRFDPIFFAKCIFYMYHEAAKISWERFYGFYPFRNSFFSPPLGPARVLQKLRDMRKRLFALPKQRGY